MIRVIMEMVPHGIEEDSSIIEEVTIINTCDHPAHPEFGNYKINFRKAQRVVKIPDHKRIDGIWPLLVRAIEEFRK